MNDSNAIGTTISIAYSLIKTLLIESQGTKEKIANQLNKYLVVVTRIIFPELLGYFEGLGRSEGANGGVTE